MSPNERVWMENVREVATAVLDYKARPAPALMMLNDDVRLIIDYGRLDLNRLLQKGISLKVNSGKLPPAQGSLYPPESEFWQGVGNGATEVLDCREDFVKYRECVLHDVTHLARYNGVYVFADVYGFVPKVLQWSENARAM